MPEITFPDPEPRYISNRDCLAFRAGVDGKPVDCLVSGELLSRQFGAKDLTEGEMREAYHKYTPELQDLARSQIEHGWIDQNNRVFLTTRYTRLHVTFDDQLGLGSNERSLAETAHRVLLELIGPTAEEVSVEWSCAKEDRRRAAIAIHITDPVIPWSVSTILHSKDWEDPGWLQIHLAQLWGSLLQARLRDQVMRTG